MSHSIKTIIKNLVGEDSIKFFLKRANITDSEIKIVDISKEQLLNSAKDFGARVNGTFVTLVDVLASYLLFTEDKTKLLFSKKLKEEDSVNIATWTRKHFPEEEIPPKTRVIFLGEGIGDNWVTGWTLETKRYTRDYTKLIRDQRPLIEGREKEFDSLLGALIKKSNNNVLLVGELGVGKESLVEAFAYDSFYGLLKLPLNHKRTLEVLVGALLAGVNFSGELEGRLQAIIEEVSHAENIVLFLPEFQNVLGVSATGIDLSGVLLPYLKDARMPIIATITPGNYKKFLQNNPLREVFEVIQITEPNKELALKMVVDKLSDIEKETRVSIIYLSATAAIDFAKKYAPDDYLPGSAVKLITDTAYALAKTKGKESLTPDEIFDFIESKTHLKIGLPTVGEKKLLLSLEQELHKRVVGQEEAIKAISEALRRVRVNLQNQNRPVSFLFLGPTGVGKTETARVLADTYYGGEKNIVRLDMSEYSDTEAIERLIGSGAIQHERGELTEKVHDSPFTLILLDEFEKASEEVKNLFLQILDDGRLTDGRGVTVSFANTIIIATSNAGSEYIREQIVKGVKMDKVFKEELISLLESQGIFKPELLNRFDGVIAFTPLNEIERKGVIKLLLEDTAKKLQGQDIKVSFDEKIIEKIISESFNEAFGARPFRRYIQDKIEDPIARKILEGEIKRGDNLLLSVGENGEIGIKKS